MYHKENNALPVWLMILIAINIFGIDFCILSIVRLKKKSPHGPSFPSSWNISIQKQNIVIIWAAGVSTV